MAIEVAIKVRVWAAFPLADMGLDEFGKGVAKVEELKRVVAGLGFVGIEVESKMGNMRGDDEPAPKRGRAKR